jgi:S-adenosyl methyltransferase
VCSQRKHPAAVLEGCIVTNVTADDRVLSHINPNVPTIARVYDYWLGGKDNFAVDRELAERFVQADPMAVVGVRSNRAFLRRAVRYLAAEVGIRQFLDIGTGIPTANNTHEVAQSVDPQCRVVYVDNDPMVLAHARALLTSVSGPTAYIDADARDTGKILAEAADTLDFSQPVAVMLIGLLHCIPDGDNPYRIVTELMSAVIPGSYLAISHPASDIHAGPMAEGAAMMNKSLPVPVTFRPYDQVVPFFDGFDLIEPGVVPTTQWRPDPGADTTPLPGWVGVALKSPAKPAL